MPIMLGNRCRGTAAAARLCSTVHTCRQNPVTLLFYTSSSSSNRLHADSTVPSQQRTRPSESRKVLFTAVEKASELSRRIVRMTP